MEPSAQQFVFQFGVCTPFDCTDRGKGDMRATFSKRDILGKFPESRTRLLDVTYKRRESRVKSPLFRPLWERWIF